MRIMPLLVLGAGVLARWAGVGSDNAARPDLTGAVLTEDGSPLKGATVFIYTAGTKVGRGTL